MKPYTWKELADASKGVRHLVIETYGLIGAVALELSYGLEELDIFTPCNVRKLLGSCDSCGLNSEGSAQCFAPNTLPAWIEWYAKLYFEKYGKDER